MSPEASNLFAYPLEVAGLSLDDTTEQIRPPLPISILASGDKDEDKDNDGDHENEGDDKDEEQEGNCEREGGDFESSGALPVWYV